MTCRYGMSEAVCRGANDLLEQIGVDRLVCSTCRLDDATRQVISRLSTDEGSVRRWLVRMGLPASTMDAKAVLGVGFNCPVIAEPVVAPCALYNCAYHIDYPWAANCLLAYLQQQEVETLTPEEISYLYQQPLDRVKSTLNAAAVKLRSSALDIQAVEDPYLAPQFRYFVTKRVCVVCESVIDDGETPKSLTIPSINAVYCSKECREEKPPRVVELEVEKGIPISVILDWTFHHYRTVALAEQALGMPRWLLQQTSQRFLGRSLESYFTEAAVGKVERRMMLIRRSWDHPTSVTSMLAAAQPRDAEVRRRFGPLTVRLSNLRSRLAYLLENL
jgi:hypothetical protein